MDTATHVLEFVFCHVQEALAADAANFGDAPLVQSAAITDRCFVQISEIAPEYEGQVFWFGDVCIPALQLHPSPSCLQGAGQITDKPALCKGGISAATTVLPHYSGAGIPGREVHDILRRRAHTCAVYMVYGAQVYCFYQCTKFILMYALW
jgi:hypothetical protein